MRTEDRSILMHAVRVLVHDAIKARANWTATAPERQFYLGVEAAAAEVLQPELARRRVAHWLDREPAAYREGYTCTTTILAIAAASPQVPMRIPLPELPAHLRRVSHRSNDER